MPPIPRLLRRLVLAAALASAAFAPADARPHRKAPPPAPRAAPGPARDWAELSFFDGFNIVYVDRRAVTADGHGGVSISTLTVSLDDPDGAVFNSGSKRNLYGREVVLDVSCGLRLIRAARVVHAWPAPRPAGDYDYAAHPGYLPQRSRLMAVIDAACAGAPSPLTGPGLATSQAAYQEGVGRLHPQTPSPPPVPAPRPPEEPSGWVADPKARYVEIPGAADAPGAVLFLDAANSGRPAGGGFTARTLVVLGPDYMRDVHFWDPVVLVRIATYDCERRTMTAQGQAGFTSSGEYRNVGAGYTPRSASESPALAAEIDAVCAMAEGRPPPGERYSGWWPAYQAARARWPAPAPDMPPPPPVMTPPPPAPPRPSIITNPDWIRQPTPQEIQAAYPARAARDRIDGRAVISCKVGSRGRLVGCSVVVETPADYGFGEAALKLSRVFRMVPATRDGAPTEGQVYRIPIAFHPRD